MGKYSPLADYFAKQAADSLTLSFEDIEEIISDDLPKSAYTSEDWWTKSSSPQSTAWSRAGYEVSINLKDMKAEFIRSYDVSRELSYVNEIENFYRRWNISIEKSSNNEFQKFKNRLINLITPHIAKFYYNNVDSEFCMIAGIKYNFLFDNFLAPSARLYDFKAKDSVIYNAFNNTKSPSSLIFLLQCFFIALYNSHQFNLVAELFPQLKEVLDLSPSMGVQASNSDNKVVFYPAGAKLLDREIINKDLQWLMEYPDVLELFEKSLTDYMKYTGANAESRSILDNLRASLEKLLKTILNNDKTLENNAKDIKNWLKGKNIHPNIVNSVGVFNHLNNYIHFMNDVKHNNPEVSYTKNEIEHMIYQTGIFIRLIIETEKNK